MDCRSGPLELKDAVAVVTGASSGLGERTAIALARKGAPVVLAARRVDRLEALAERIEASGGRAVPGLCGGGGRASTGAPRSNAEGASGRSDGVPRRRKGDRARDLHPAMGGRTPGLPRADAAAVSMGHAGRLRDVAAARLARAVVATNPMLLGSRERSSVPRLPRRGVGRS